MHNCPHCTYSSNRGRNVRRHIEAKHNVQRIPAPGGRVSQPQLRGYTENSQNVESVKYPGQESYDSQLVSYDIRLKENFKLFVSGPSRCGKTFFVADMLQNIQTFAKQPPSLIIYIYKVWQSKFDEMKSLVHVFLEDEENIVNKIKEYANGNPILVVFDDMINSKSLANIANLFTVDGRHMNMSMVFLTQRMFVNDEYFRQISQNCDYFFLFKNPRNSAEIRTLAQQVTPGTLHLIKIFIEATKDPFSYLCVNLTQECQPEVKYLAQLFDKDHSVKCFVEST